MLLRGLTALLGLLVVSVLLLLNVNPAWAAPTVTPTIPEAGVSFTISGPSSPHGVYVFTGTCSSPGLGVYSAPPSGAYSVTVPPQAAGQYAVNDSTACVNFMVEPFTSGGGQTVTTSAGSFSSLTTSGAPPPPPNPPAGVIFPNGLLSFTIVGLAPGQIVMVTITLPKALCAPGSCNFVWYKFVNGAWSLCRGITDADGSKCLDYTINSSNTVLTITFQASPSGTVNDPAGAAIPAGVIPEYPLGLSVLAIFMMIAYGVVRRRTQPWRTTSTVKFSSNAEVQFTRMVWINRLSKPVRGCFRLQKDGLAYFRKRK